MPPPLMPKLSLEPPGSTVIKTTSNSGSLQSLMAVLLSVCLGLFVLDAVISLADDSLILFAGSHLLSAIRGLIGLLAILMAIGIYALMALTPMVPKKIFMPVALYNLLAMLASFPLIIYFFGRIQLVSWVFSAIQVLLAGWLLVLVQGGFKFRWPLVPKKLLGSRAFSWSNLNRFVLVNVFVVAPAMLVYVFFCCSRAVDHFTDGFMALHPGGFSVQVRTYARADGKTIELFPMAHVADAGFYQQVERTFPTNSVILMEGVTDSQNLLTNKISYARMAKTLGLAEQHKAFEPTRGRLVPADVDVDTFSTDTIQLLNLVMLIHVKGVTPENLAQLMDYSPSPKMQDELMDDLLHNRNRHLVKEIKAYLPEANHIMVPWGVAHMPGIAKAIQELGLRLVDSENYTVIRFHGHDEQRSRGAKPGAS